MCQKHQPEVSYNVYPEDLMTEKKNGVACDVQVAAVKHEQELQRAVVNHLVEMHEVVADEVVPRDWVIGQCSESNGR